MSRIGALRAQTHIVLWTIACILPMLGGALYATWRLAEAEREAERTQILQTALGLSAAVDLKLEKGLAALATLGISPALTPGNLAEFYDQCAAVARQHDSWILLIDSSGQPALEHGTTVRRRSAGPAQRTDVPRARRREAAGL